MQIDFAATRANMRHIRITKWSQMKGFCDATVRRVLSGTYPCTPQGGRFQAVVDALRADGLLVEVDDESIAV